MGQKNNANFLRLGLKTTWNSYYIEKNLEDSSFYLFLNIVLKKYVINFFKIYDILLFYCKTSLSFNVLKILISFFVTQKTIKKILKLNKKFYQRFFFKDKKKLNNAKKTPNNFLRSKKKSKNVITKKFLLFYKTKIRFLKIKRKKISFFFKKWISKKEFLLNSFSKQIFNILKVYLFNKINFILVFQKFNKGYSVRLKNKEINIFKKIIIQLRSFLKFNFFKDIINILIIILKKKKAIKLLCEYIAFQISLNKRHNFFLRFLRSSLTFFLKSSISCVVGLKLLLKGRVNGFSRSSTKGFSLGKLPRNSLSSNIFYFNSIAYTLNGTIGVKLWVCANY